MSIFDFDDYKLWTNTVIAGMPKAGRGQFAMIAKHLSTSASIVTQVFKGDRELTAEQSVLIADYFGLTEFERFYLILLVNYSRAGSHRYKQILKKEIDIQRQKAKEIKSHVAQNIEVTEETKSILYSNWHYLAIWSLTAIDGFNSLGDIVARLGINKTKANEAIQFLLKSGLIVEVDGHLKVGPTLFHLESTSPHIPRHHQNWRLRAFQKYESPQEDDVFYTAPVTLSEEDAKAIRAKVVKFIAEAINTVKASRSEKLRCLCIDWFEV